MSTFPPEMKPWENYNDGSLNPNAYAAIAVFGVTTMSVKAIHDSGKPLGAKVIGDVTLRLAAIISRVQNDAGSGGGWGSGLNARIRGALHTALEVYPLDSLDNLDDWAERLYDLTKSITLTAEWLWRKTARQKEGS